MTIVKGEDWDQEGTPRRVTVVLAMMMVALVLCLYYVLRRCL